jgi:Tfp pilus assembly protein PilF
MDLKVVSGKTIELPAEFFAGDEPTDPLTPRIDIVDPGGAVVVSNGVPARSRKGVYFYNFPVPAAAPAGTWKAVWTARIDGSRVSAADLFEVSSPIAAGAKPEAPAAKVAPPAAPRPAAPDAPKQPAAQPAAVTPKPAASKPAGTLEPEVDSAGTTPGAPEKEAAGAGPPKDSRGGIGKRARKREVAAAAAALSARTATEPESESTPEPPVRKRRGGTDGGAPRSRLSMGKVLLILAALGVVLSSIWFSPRRDDTLQAKIDEGVAAQKAGRTDEAERLYEEVLSNDPTNKLANFNLGVAAQVAGDMEKAESFYEKSLETDPVFLPALFNLAILQERTDRNEESAETYRRLLEQYPDNGPAHLNYAFLLTQKLNKPDEGREEFRIAVEKDPTLARRIPADMRPAPAAP